MRLARGHKQWLKQKGQPMAVGRYIENADLNTKPVRDWTKEDFARARKEFLEFDNARRKRESMANK